MLVLPSQVICFLLAFKASLMLIETRLRVLWWFWMTCFLQAPEN